MTDVVKDSIDQIADACRNMQVKYLHLFGSGATDDQYNPANDPDFLLQYNKDQEGLPIAGISGFKQYENDLKTTDSAERRLAIIGEPLFKAEKLEKSLPIPNLNKLAAQACPGSRL